MSIPKFRTYYDLGDPLPGVSFDDEPDITVQSAANECDINLIVDRARRGIAPPVSTRIPRFGDFSTVSDYQSMLNSVIEAQDQFDSLPAKIRDRFQNNPAKLLEFLSNESNRDEAIKLGLIEPPVVEEPPQAAPVAPPGAAEAP